MNKVRNPSAAGFFYPANSSKLQEEIDLFLSLAQPEKPGGSILGLVSPHAGYIYSGKTAAFGFKLIKDQDFNKIIIISPSHREYFPGISVYDGDAYKTPLGSIPVDNELAEKLTTGSKFIFRGIEGHREEHAVEVQLPFLQRVLKDFQILPVVMGDQGYKYITELSSRMAELVDANTLIVASSDLSHYHSKGEAHRLDSIVARRISEFDFDGLQSDLEKRTCEACGGGPIVTMMRAASMVNKSKAAVLNRSDSGDVSGDNFQVVGYLSAAIYG